MLQLRSQLPLGFVALMLLCLGGNTACAEVQHFTVPSTEVDPAMKLVPGDHSYWVNNAVPPRGELLIFITGTGGRSQGPDEFFRTAANVGYHVIMPLYANDVPAAVCAGDPARAAFENFRREIIEGRDLTPLLEVGPADSINNRILKLVQWLKQHRPPEENWGQFFDKDGGFIWRKVVLAGHSQGGGHALLMAQDHEVARVIMTGAPKDFSQARHKPAAWYRPGKTPVSRMFALNHEQDFQGCSPTEQLENYTAARLAPVRNVDQLAPPYDHAHAFTTNFPGTALDSGTAHISVIIARAAPRDADGAPHFKLVWLYMLTEPVE